MPVQAFDSVTLRVWRKELYHCSPPSAEGIHALILLFITTGIVVKLTTSRYVMPSTDMLPAYIHILNLAASQIKHSNLGQRPSTPFTTPQFNPCSLGGHHPVNRMDVPHWYLKLCTYLPKTNSHRFCLSSFDNRVFDCRPVSRLIDVRTTICLQHNFISKSAASFFELLLTTR